MKKLLYCCLVVFVAQSYASESVISVPQKATAAKLLNMTSGQIKRVNISGVDFLSCKMPGLSSKIYYVAKEDSDKFVCIGNRDMVRALLARDSD